MGRLLKVDVGFFLRQPIPKSINRTKISYMPFVVFLGALTYSSDRFIVKFDNWLHKLTE